MTDAVSAAPLLEARHLFKVFGRDPKDAVARLRAGHSRADVADAGTAAVVDASFTVNRGEIFVIMGLSGSGKSTIIRMLNGLLAPTAGEVTIDGRNVTTASAAQLRSIRRESVSMVFQHFALLPHLSVLDNAAYALEIQGVGKTERRERARDILERVGLGDRADALPDQLSGGMRQRVGIARALSAGTDILLMDEAFSALDPLIRREMQDQLLQLQSKLNKTIVFITHDLDEALRLGNRIAILKDGELVQEGTPEDILLNPANDYVQSFLQDVNRTKVLNATHAVNPARLTLTMRSRPAHSVDRMRALNYEYAPVLDGKRLAGVLTLVAAEQAVREGGRDVSRFVEDLASVPATAGLGEVLAQLVHSDQPVAVTGENDEFIGMLSRKKVVELVTPVLAETAPTDESAVSAETPPEGGQAAQAELQGQPQPAQRGEAA